MNKKKYWKKYWNDTDVERSKPYWIESPDDNKLQVFLKEKTNLFRCFNDAVGFVEKYLGGIKGNVLDIGAGVAWTSAIISRFPSVRTVTAVDCSEHRLKRIAPVVFSQMHGDISKFIPVVDMFTVSDFKNKNFDIILFCQSLYMFPSINRLIRDVAELLVSDGVLMVVAERITPQLPIFSPGYFKQIFSRLIYGRADDSGNHYYTDREYRKAILKAGLKYYFQELDYPVFSELNIMAGNHFGVKISGGGKYDTCG